MNEPGAVEGEEQGAAAAAGTAEAAKMTDLFVIHMCTEFFFQLIISLCSSIS